MILLRSYWVCDARMEEILVCEDVGLSRPYAT